MGEQRYREESCLKIDFALMLQNVNCWVSVQVSCSVAIVFAVNQLCSLPPKSCQVQPQSDAALATALNVAAAEARVSSPSS